jgi:hypothetical protein
MGNLFREGLILTLGLLVLLVGTASAELFIDQKYQLISSTRVGRTAYDYTYQVNITNDGPDVQNVTATVSSNSVNTTIIDGAVNFGDVSPGGTVTGVDYFTIRQNRSYSFDPAVLSWSIQFELAAQVIPPEGGVIQGEGGIFLIVPGGATSEPIPVTITQLLESELGAPTPPNTTFLGGATVDIGANKLDDNADISIPAPAGVLDGAVVYLVKVVEYASQNVFYMVDTAIVQNGIITSQDPAFPGITTTGSYVFLLWSTGAGWVEGQVSNVNTGSSIPDAVVTLSGGYWLDIADANGFYSLPAWAGNFVVNAFDDSTGDFGEKQGFMPYGGATVIANVEIGESSGETQTTLINGNFEDGLTGWSLSGAGDVIGSFGPIFPYEGNYMAMISSGDGAIGESSSSLEQTFTVPTGAKELSLHYNFISEEYPEYVGSSFNDVMNVTLHTPDGSREVAFEEVNSANFQPVSGVPCGSGDCTWGQTGWLETSVDVSEWAGTDDTLTLTVHDVGDTVYDTVVLLDAIGFDMPSFSSGQVVSDSVSPGQWKHYKLTSSEDAQVSFDLTHQTADLDLYVKKGNKPTLTDYDCRPYKEDDGNYHVSETCIQDNNDETTWYVGVYGHEEGGDYRLKAIVGDVAGWASETGFKQADTDIRERIVDSARAAVGELSGQSHICTAGACWLTDTACYENFNGDLVCDGSNMRNAITVYHNWREANPYGPIDEATFNNIRAEFNTSDYNDTSKTGLAHQIVKVYDGTVPETDESTLDYLGIQKQCLEWAMHIAMEAGGAQVNYSGNGKANVINFNDIRPGVGSYAWQYHARLVVDVRYNQEGAPVELEVAESNWGSGWNNPGGMVPWDRDIKINRYPIQPTFFPISYDKSAVSAFQY